MERKQKVYELICDERFVPMKIKEIAIMMQAEKEERAELERILEELQEEGKIERNGRGKYRKPEKRSLTGIFDATAKGFGFVEVQGWQEDIFIPANATGGAMHGDTVQIELLPGKKGKRREGIVTAILSRALTEIVGTYEKSKNFGFVVPDARKLFQDIFIPKEFSMDARDGQKVLAELTDYGNDARHPEGRIKKIIGYRDDPGVDMLSVACAYGFAQEFPDRVLAQAERVGKEVSEADRAGRMDLREICMVTIDGEDAKDLDDAVSLTKEGEIWHLGVHIADVANYVQENSALDREALKRGTSVYFPGSVIPMLPPFLSNGACSLNAGQDRLALSCLMDIDEKGNVTGHQIAETVICVNRRLSYDVVKKILTGEDETAINEYKELIPMLRQMDELAKILRKKRKQRGSIDFDFPESKIRLDENGRPVEILPYERNDATKLIEDFMLIANETVAQDYFWQDLPFLYRTHENPDPDKIRQFAILIAGFGYGIRAGKDEIHPKELQKLLTRIEGSAQEGLISRLALRSMKQAKYTRTCSGHFGLASAYYCHFTSPIRRYPDLQIHRIIKENLHGRLNEKRIGHYEELLEDVAQQCSRMERRAAEAEREAQKQKKAEYMQAHVDENDQGVISGMNPYGFYVELPNTVEGFVHVGSLRDDNYSFDENAYELRGEHTGKIYRIGQQVQVRVLGADKQAGTVDFAVFCEEQ